MRFGVAVGGHTNFKSSVSYGYDTWHKVVFTQDGASTGRLFINGAADGSTTGQSATQATADFHIGSRPDAISWSHFEGELRNIEIYSGEASNPTAWVPGNTSSLSGVSLVMQSSDGSGLNNGQGVVFAENGNPSAIYDSSSAYFDGSNDYLEIPDSDDWYFGSGDFTMDMWVKNLQGPGDVGVILMQGNTTGSHSFRFAKWSSNRVDMVQRSGGWRNEVINSANDGYSNLTDGEWHHLAFTDNGSVGRIYEDGVLIAENTSASHDWHDNSSTLQIGHERYSSPRDFVGYLDELRISKGVDRTTQPSDPLYIASPGTCVNQGDVCFTPPTAPYSASAPADTTPPTINSITSTDSAGDYEQGETIALDVAFDENVVINGVGTLEATMSNGDTVALSIVDANATGSYTVSNATAGALSVTAVAVNGAGTLEDAAGNAADLTIPANLS